MNYLKKHYKAAVVLAIVMILIATVFSGTTIKTNGYSVDNIYNTINELSSSKYMGRRFGTKENMDAARYIEEQFKSIGLKPAGEDNTFLRSYTTVTKVSNGVPVLEVLSRENRIIKQYKYGKDFTETGIGLSSPGEVFSEAGFIDYPNGLEAENFNTSREIAVIYDMEMGENQTQNLYMDLKKAGVKAIIKIVPDDYNIGRAYASVGLISLQKTGYEMPTLSLSENVKEEILEYCSLGYKIHMKTTTDKKPVTIPDVMGMIPGRTDEYLFITAHMDHIGTSADGRIFPGALDNASGTAAMIEIARYMKVQGKKPNKNIVFVAFNGEEGGAIGSYNYVRHPVYPLYKTTVINLDMIGAAKDVPVNVNYADIKGYEYDKSENINPASKLRYQLKNLALELGVPYEEQYDNSGDHVPFNLYGVPAITITDNDRSKIYSTEDGISNISKDNIDRDMKLIMHYISLFAYSNGRFAGNKLVLLDVWNFIKTQYPFIVIIMVLFILMLLIYKKRASDSSGSRRKIPLVTIGLIMVTTGIISYFPIRYPYAPAASSANAAGLFTEGILSIFKAPLLWPFYFLYIIPGVIIFAIVKQRQLHWNYKGNGKELDIVFYVSVVLIVILSAIGNTLFFNKQTFYAVTPDFARAFSGKLILHIVLGGVAYLLYKAMKFEINAKNKGYKGLVSFALIFIILLSSFYMPITINKYVINANSSIVNLTEEEDIHRIE